MTKSLSQLQIATDGASGAGEDFSTDVAGATSLGGGERFSYYDITGWSFGGSAPVTDAGNYVDGHNFSMSVDFTQGILASYIKRTGSGIITFSLVGAPVGASILSSSSSIVSAASGSTAAVQIRPPFSASQTFGFSTTYDNPAYNYNSMSSADWPPHTGGEQATCSFQVNGSGSETVYLDINAQLNPNINGSNYNDNLQMQWDDIPFTSRALFPSEMTIEWYWTSTDRDNGTNRVYLGHNFGFSSSPDTWVTMYLRYKKPGDVSWTNTSVTFQDPRPDV